MSMFPSQTDVLIVGAGPAGLALACSLQQAGIRHVLIDTLEAGRTLRAPRSFTPTHLEVLEGIGVADNLVGAGLKLSTFTVRDRDRALISASFDHLPSRYSYLLMIPQNATEAILARQLEALGGQIYRSHAATGVEPIDGSVRVSVTAPTGEKVNSAKYVVGADGMHSVVREAARISFEGERYPDSFVLADVRIHWPLQNEGSLFFSVDGVLVVVPLPDGIVSTGCDARKCAGASRRRRCPGDPRPARPGRAAGKDHRRDMELAVSGAPPARIDVPER